MSNQMGRKILPMTGSLFASMFTTGRHDGYEVIKNALPPDAKLIGARMADFNRPDTFELLFRSSEFEPVGEDQLIPRIVPMLKRIPVAEKDA